MGILLCPLVLVVNIDDVVSAETCLICKEHWWNKETPVTSLNKALTKVLSHNILSAITHKLNVSRHMLIWTFFIVLICGTHAQSMSSPFSYILYVCIQLYNLKRLSPVPIDKLCVGAFGFNSEPVSYIDMQLATRRWFPQFTFGYTVGFCEYLVRLTNQILLAWSWADPWHINVVHSSTV
jgi:hypothetical protein